MLHGQHLCFIRQHQSGTASIDHTKSYISGAVIPRRDRIRDDPDDLAVDSLAFIVTLPLTREQVRAILPLYQEACRLCTDHYCDRAEIQPIEFEAYAALLEEDRPADRLSREAFQAVGGHVQR